MMESPAPVTRFDMRSQDPEYAHAVLRDAYTDFTVRSSGPADDFQFAYGGLAAPGVAVCRVRYGMAATMDVESPGRALFVTTPVSGKLSVTAGRERAIPAPGEPLLTPVHTGWHTDVDDAALESVILDRTAVERVASSMFQIDPAALRFSSMLPVSPSAGRYWQSVVDHVRRDVLADDEVAGSPLALAEATRWLAVAVLVAFPNPGTTEQDGRQGWAEPAVLRRAVAYIDEHAGEDIGVDDIAAAARIGVRGLQYMFRRHRDRTPLEELRGVRLDRAHVDLRAADPTRGDTVTAIATRWGFTHAGRFSSEYRSRFGCSPRQTLRE